MTLSIEDRIGGFIVDLSHVFQTHQITLVSFKFKGVGEDIEMTVIDNVEGKYYDLLMNPKSKAIIESGDAE